MNGLFMNWRMRSVYSGRGIRFRITLLYGNLPQIMTEETPPPPLSAPGCPPHRRTATNRRSIWRKIGASRGARLAQAYTPATDGRYSKRLVRPERKSRPLSTRTLRSRCRVLRGVPAHSPSSSTMVVRPPSSTCPRISPWRAVRPCRLASRSRRMRRRALHAVPYSGLTNSVAAGLLDGSPGRLVMGRPARCGPPAAVRSAPDAPGRGR